jgi:protein-S-isoprenylcysteine O-methyltransferase Ste14
MNTLKIARSFVLPVIYFVVVPAIIHCRFEMLLFQNLFSTILGSLFILTGIGFITWTNVLFVSFADGTMLRLDAPKKMVVLGPFRYVRNPIATAMVTILWGEAMLFGSLFIFGWSIVYFILINAYILYKEEPELARKFGEAYLRYKQLVPRWIPLDKAVEFDPETEKRSL